MRITLTALAIAASATAAAAADMPIKALPLSLPPSWSGFYAGVNAGGGWFDPSYSTDIPSVPIAGKKPPKPPPCMKYCYSPDPLFGLGSGDVAGFVGGVQGGYNYQFLPQWVAGIEADFDAAAFSKSRQIGFLTLPGSSASMGERVDWLSSLRGRIGYLWTPTVMLYATGGVAFADINYSATANVTSSAVAATSFDNIRTGWVVGGGGEYMLTPQWILRGEYLFYSFNGTSSSVPLAPAVTSTPVVFTWNKVDVSVFRAGVSYHF
jgi:outer membrane immunogenic protein